MPVDADNDTPIDKKLPVLGAYSLTADWSAVTSGVTMGWLLPCSDYTEGVYCHWYGDPRPKTGYFESEAALTRESDRAPDGCVTPLAVIYFRLLTARDDPYISSACHRGLVYILCSMLYTTASYTAF